MLKKFGWLTPLAVVALATAGCSGAAGDEENATNEEPTAGAPQAAAQNAGENAAAPNENGNVGQSQSQWLGFGGWGGCGLGACGAFGVPGVGFGVPGVGFGFPGVGLGFVNPGFGLGFGAPGFIGPGFGWGRAFVW